jgi:hypothetical protein
MQFAMFGAFFCLASGLVYAESWSGALVDPKCFEALERNANPTDTLTHVDRDTNQEIRYCSPNAKTKLFGIVEQDGTILRFDSTGNAKAAELVRPTHKNDRLHVVVTGEMSGRTIKVDSISGAR